MKKKLIAILILTLVFNGLAACSSKNNENVGTQSESKSNDTDLEEDKEVEVESEPVPLSPVSYLTGEITTEEIVKNRPLSVMIENTKVCLPHYGLADAGIIYEAMAEGGITRYIAFYDDYSNFERLGNVRSARPYYIYIAKEYDSIYAHVGQSEQALEILNRKVIDDLNGLYSGEAFYRVSDRKAPHSTYISTEGILKDIEKKGYKTSYDEPVSSHFKFASEENLLSEGEDCKRLNIYYQNNKPYFIYDTVKKTYARYEFGEKEPDALNPEGINVTNIIFQNAASRVVGKEGQLEIDIVGKGVGKFFTRGKMVDITWEKKNISDITRYYMPDGSEIELNPGKTFVCIIENQYSGQNSFEP